MYAFIYLIFHFFLKVNARTSREDLLPTPPYTKGVCHQEPCDTMLINAEMYIEEELYRLTEEFLAENNVTGDITHIVSQRIDDMFTALNVHLMNLDNGGYKLISDGSFTLLNDAKFKIKETFIDRNDGNRSKTFDKLDLWAWTFGFQEAVGELLGHNSSEAEPHVRILLRYTPGKLRAATEENCICNPDWPFACIAIFSLDQWYWRKGSLFAHEIGHALGREIHDDEIYQDPDHELIMNSVIGIHANIWSPEAKKSIQSQYKKYHENCLPTTKSKISGL